MQGNCCGTVNALNLAGNKHMKMLKIKAQWNIVKGRLKQKFAQLANDDLQFIEGKQDELIGRIQERTRQAGENNKHAADVCYGCKH